MNCAPSIEEFLQRRRERVEAVTVSDMLEESERRMTMDITLELLQTKECRELVKELGGITGTLLSEISGLSDEAFNKLLREGIRKMKRHAIHHDNAGFTP